MTQLAKSVCWIALLLLLAGSAGRLLWRAAHTDTGLQTISQQWQNATLGLVRGPRVPIYSREPVDQGAYWLQEVDRVLGPAPPAAELAIGAALVLDSACPEFLAWYVIRLTTFPPAVLPPELDDEGIERATDAFEQICRQRCLELAAAATELEPARAEWWRLRALLLWRSSPYSEGSSPRDPDWRGLLDECAGHDPDNALYDYLAAYFDWQSSAEIDYSGDEPRFAVTNDLRFQRGIECFERGQTKPNFTIDDAGFSAVASFLSLTGCPLDEQPNVVNSRNLHLRRSLFLRNVWRWQSLRADQEVAAGRFENGMAMHRANLRLFEQLTGGDALLAYDPTVLACRLGTTDQMARLAGQHPDTFRPEEIGEIAALHEQVKIMQAVGQRAAAAVITGAAQPPAGASWSGLVLIALTIYALASVAFLLLMLGCLAILLGRLLDSHDRTHLGLAGQTLATVGACALTITAVGLAPAQIVHQQIQAWVLTLLVMATAIVLLSWAAWVWLRRRAFQYNLGELLTCVLLCCLLLTVVVVTRPAAGKFGTTPFDLAVPARGWEGWDATSVEMATRPLGSWVWAACQWTAYHGHYLTVAAWAALVAMLLFIKSRLARRLTPAAPPSFRDRAGALCRSLGRPAVTLAALALAAYLALAPTVIDATEQHFQAGMATVRQRAELRLEMDRAIQQVRADGTFMEGLRNAAEVDSPETPPDDGE